MTSGSADWTARSPTAADAWSKPVNVGSPLNTPGDEHGLVTSADGQNRLFFQPAPGTSGLDIMTWTLPEPLRARASVVVKGQLNISDELSETPINLELRYAQSRRAQAIELGDDGAFAAVVDLSSPRRRDHGGQSRRSGFQRRNRGRPRRRGACPGDRRPEHSIGHRGQCRL